MSKQIKRIPGTATMNRLDLPKYDSPFHRNKTSAESAINHAYFRAKKQHIPMRVTQNQHGDHVVHPATETIPDFGNFYDVYSDGVVYSRG